MSSQHDALGAEPEESGEAGQQAEATPREPDRGGWSGRAVGPLSGLLPGGAVELSADEAEGPEPGLSATDERWHAILVGFVDDPRGSVEAARALIDVDIASHIAQLARRKEAMHAAWRTSEDADTEALRVALVNYRELRNRLAAVLNAEVDHEEQQRRPGVAAERRF